MDRWVNPGDAGVTEKFSTGAASAQTALNNLINSDAVISDASYIRLKNVALSYALPDKWQRAMRMQSCRVFFQGQNLLTITNYKGLDPETQGQSLTLPPLRTLTVGVQVAF